MEHKGTETLYTERLSLRKSEIGEADENDDDPEVHKDFLVRIINGYGKADFYFWTVTEKKGGKAVGYIRTIDSDEKTLSCGIAYETKAKYRNNGYASEALKRVLAFLLAEVGYNRVSGGLLADNPASGRVMEKAGMKYEGTLRQDTATARAF
jgi:ribosomal-protein-alanine N-acetyltransferase